MADVEFDDLDDRIGVVRLNRPAKLNAFDESMRAALTETLASSAVQDKYVVIIEGAGTSFSSGLDVTRLRERDTGTDGRPDLPTGLPGYSHLIRGARPVFISAVRGYALGMGADIAVAADLTIASESARIGYPQINHRLIAGVAMVGLKQAAPAKRALELVLTARTVDAHEALELGLVNEVVTDDRLDERARELARVIAEKDLMSVRLTKRLFYESSEMPYELALHAGVRANTLFRR